MDAGSADGRVAGRARARPRPRPRRSSATEVGKVSLKDGELAEPNPVGEGSLRSPGALASAVHRRHMPTEPLRFHIPRKSKEQRALFQYVSNESREFEDMLSVMTGAYRDNSSAGCFSYSKPRLVHSELQEKEFVEKRKELKADGRTDKELEETHCFLLVDPSKLPQICEKGLLVGHSWLTSLGNPSKGVYLSKHSDLLQMNSFSPGDTGEVLIFKVMKGKVKSVYDNSSKTLSDPTPRFDGHVSKNVSRVTSLSSFRAFEHTQHYFYEYSFDVVCERPRQVCPYAVVSFLFKGKDAPPPSKPLPPLRLNSQSAEAGKERVQFPVWSGDLVNGDRLMFHLSLLSFSPPFLPCRLQEKIKVDSVMSFDHVTKVLPASIFSWNLYASSHEVVKCGRYCSLLEAVGQSSESSVSRLLEGLEKDKMVLVTPLPDSGFLFLLSSVQMASPSERGEGWRRCLQALFVFPETRDVTKSTPPCGSSSRHSSSSGTVISQLADFLPALHHSLVKVRANPPDQLSAAVEQLATEYLSGLRDGKGRVYPLGEYDCKLDDRVKLFPAPKHHKANMEGYLRSYLYGPTLYLLSVAKARHLLSLHHSAKLDGDSHRRSSAGECLQPTDPRKQVMDLAEKEVVRQVVGGASQEAVSRKRRLEQEAAERKLKVQRRMSQDAGHSLAVEDSQSPSLSSISSVMGSVGLKDIDLRKDGSEDAVKLLSLLSGLNQSGCGMSNQNQAKEEGPGESGPFYQLATKLGLPTNCDIDLRKQELLEEQTMCSVSSLEGFSPASHGGDTNPSGAKPRRAGEEEEKEEEKIPWVLIPITGLRSERYSSRSETEIPMDPRFHQPPATATGVTMGTSPTRRSPTPTPSPEPSPPPSPLPPQKELSPVDEVPHQTNEELVLPTASRESTENPTNIEEGRKEEKSRPPIIPSAAPEISFREEEWDARNGELLEQIQKSTEEAERERVASFSPPSPRPPVRDVDSILQDHLGDFSSELQHLLLEKSIHYTPSLPHISGHTHFVQSPLAGFSQYVSFYSACPPVHDYVSSLRDAVNSLLLDIETRASTDANARTNANASTATSARTDANASMDAIASMDDSARVDANTSSIASAHGDASADVSITLASSVRDFLSTVRATSGVAVLTPDLSSREMGWLNSFSPLVSDKAPSVHSAPSPPSPSQCSSSSSGSIAPEHLSPLQSRLTSCPTAGPGSSPSGQMSAVKSEVTVHGLGGDLEPVPVPDLILNQNPHPMAISSLIQQLEPEVLSNLVNIIKDVKKKSVQFYIHNPEQDELLCNLIKEHLLKQGHVEGSPVAFLNNENPRRLLVVIQNKDIAAHVHKIPGLVSLKRSSSVAFVGVDCMEDLKNSSYNELFISGGCIVSDEFVLNPEIITHERLTALLMFLDQQSSPDSVWRWKVHFKSHRSLKQLSRFKHNAAILLNVLSEYQKRLLVEFLPYHHCDMSTQSPDLTCLTDLQARYTLHRHIVLLTERFEMFPNYSNSGIIVANLDDLLHNFSSLVGYHNIKDKEPITADLFSPIGGGSRRESQESSGSASSYPSVGHDLLQAPFSGLAATDQMVPESLNPPPPSSISDGPPPQSAADFEALRLAISQCRAEMARVKMQVSSGSPALSSLGGASTVPSLGGASTVPSPPLPERIQATPCKEEDEGQGGAHSGNVGRTGLPSNSDMPCGSRESLRQDTPPDTLSTNRKADPAAAAPGACTEPLGSANGNGEASCERQVANEGCHPRGPSPCALGAKVRNRQPIGGDTVAPVIQQQPVGREAATGHSQEWIATQNNPYLPQNRPSHLLPSPNSMPLFPHGPVLAPLGGMGVMLGRMPAWPLALNPAGAFVWGVPGPVPSLMGIHPQSSRSCRGGNRGGGFNGT